MQTTQITRRAALLGAAAGGFNIIRGAATPRRNVLFIAIDDLNDWIGCMGGHPQTKTPNLDRLAAKGTLFTNAHCAAPLCNPSRTALMTGIRPSTSGVYSNSQPFRQSSVLKNAVTLPMHLRDIGYKAIGAGKIYHGGFPDPQTWNDYWPTAKENAPRGAVPPADQQKPLNGIPGRASENMDWGPLNAPDEEMSDMLVTGWAAQQLSRKVNDPLFLACGIFRPHLPWYVPKKYFDMYPLHDIQLPVVQDDDLDDVPAIGRRFAGATGEGAPGKLSDHARITGAGKWKDGVQAYLASIAFADACLGKVLRALETGPNANDFTVVLWSDHGWHLGQKLHWRKFTLWEEATRNVFMVDAPGITKPGARCAKPVSLLDIYPTLIDACGAPPRKEIEGTSLIPLLKDPKAKRETPAVTTYLRGNHSVRDERWRYIHYSDGGEELYDHANDPHEWPIRAASPRFKRGKPGLRNGCPRGVRPVPPRPKTGLTKDHGWVSPME